VAASPASISHPLLGSPLQRLQLPPSPLNATEIRDLLARGESVAPLVFESVARYIDQHHLYQAA
jgi:nicotinate-nucleotide adenylyltransferase